MDSLRIGDNEQLESRKRASERLEKEERKKWTTGRTSKAKVDEMKVGKEEVGNQQSEKKRR